MLNGIKPRFDFSVAQLAGRQLNSISIVNTSGMLGPWAVPEGTNANGDQSVIHSRPVNIEASTDLHGLRPAILIHELEIGAAALRAHARRERILNATSINHG